MDEKLLELAKKGDVSAQVTLAEAFLKEGNLEEAYKWAKEASKQDSDQAELMLGYFYHHGLKVEQDLNKAKEWYKKAADQDNALACVNLGLLFEKEEKYEDAIY